MKKLDLSASNLRCALQAFKGGADCVHITNKFSLEDLRKLKQYCISNSKKLLDYRNILSEEVADYICPDEMPADNLISIEVKDNNPQLSYWAAKYNRFLLDGISADDSDALTAQKSMYEALEGEVVGTIIKTFSNKASVKFSKPVALHDTLKVQSENNSIEFTLTEIEPKMSFIPEGRTVTINFPVESFKAKPQSGTPVMHSFDDSFHSDEENMRLYKKPVDVEVTITSTSVLIGDSVFETDVLKAEKQKDINSTIREILQDSGKSFFTLGNLSVINKSPFETPFIPLSQLKAVKKSFYNKLDHSLLLS